MDKTTQILNQLGTNPLMLLQLSKLDLSNPSIVVRSMSDLTDCRQPENTMLAISQRYSVEEYLELEETAEFRSEYHDGEIILMAGESPEHNEISINLILELKPQLPEGVKLYSSDIKLWIPQYKRYVYPDLMLANLPQWMALERGGKALTNPCLIIEVLSESTRNYDQGDKFSFYRSIPELQDYLMVDQYQKKILYYCKSEGGWFLREFDRPDSTIELSSLGLTVRLVAVYKNVEI